MDCIRPVPPRPRPAPFHRVYTRAKEEGVNPALLKPKKGGASAPPGKIAKRTGYGQVSEVSLSHAMQAPELSVPFRSLPELSVPQELSMPMPSDPRMRKK